MGDVHWPAFAFARAGRAPGNFGPQGFERQSFRQHIVRAAINRAQVIIRAQRCKDACGDHFLAAGGVIRHHQAASADNPAGFLAIQHGTHGAAIDVDACCGIGQILLRRIICYRGRLFHCQFSNLILPEQDMDVFWTAQANPHHFGWRIGRIDAQVGQAIQKRIKRHAHFQLGQVLADTDVRAIAK